MPQKVKTGFIFRKGDFELKYPGLNGPNMANMPQIKKKSDYPSLTANNDKYVDRKSSLIHKRLYYFKWKYIGTEKVQEGNC